MKEPKAPIFTIAGILTVLTFVGLIKTDHATECMDRNIYCDDEGRVYDINWKDIKERIKEGKEEEKREVKLLENNDRGLGEEERKVDLKGIIMESKFHKGKNLKEDRYMAIIECEDEKRRLYISIGNRAFDDNFKYNLREKIIIPKSKDIYLAGTELLSHNKHYYLKHYSSELKKLDKIIDDSNYLEDY